MIKRRRMAVLGAFAAAASVFLLPASPAQAVTFDNACVNSLIPTQSSLIPITMTADASPNPVTIGGTVTLSNIQQHSDIPPAVFVAGYNAGVLVQGNNNIPITNIHTVIAGTNTVQGTEVTNNQTGTATTFITDPDGIPGTGDETATAGSLDVTYANQTWTAAASGPINFREDTVVLPPPVPNPPGFTNSNAGINITAVVAGVITVRFGCDPGEVVESADPSTIVRTDPAPTFASTTAEPAVTPEAPVADAGPDQTVASGALVQLDGTGTIDPNGDPITYMWTQTSGPSVALSDPTSAMPTFTAPTGPSTLTFQLEACDPGLLCDLTPDSVTINVSAPVSPAPAPAPAPAPGPVVTTPATANPACAALQQKLKKARKAHKQAKVKKLKKQLRKLGC